jgi:hypothetical protein
MRRKTVSKRLPASEGGGGKQRWVNCWHAGLAASYPRRVNGVFDEIIGKEDAKISLSEK